MFFTSVPFVRRVTKRLEEVEVQNGTDVGNLVDQLQQKYPRLRDHCQRVQMAVNQFIAPLSTVLGDGDEVAFIPQVAGG